MQDPSQPWLYVQGTHKARQRAASGTYFVVVVTPIGRHEVAVTVVN